jgi:NAD(P)-dependent dehydrogenase (short-subunit alcohol dehydrogenase family)
MPLLEGKVALITGAGRGIGRAVALAFASEGANLVLNDAGTKADGTGSDPDVVLGVQQEVQALGARAEVVCSSVAEPSTSAHMVDLALQSFGSVDVVVTCAGFVRDTSLVNASYGDFEALVQVHLGGTFLLFQAAAVVMKRQGSGSLIATTSSAGLLGNFAQSAYAAASAGVHGLVRTTSIELQRSGIRANAVAPLAKTRLTERLPMFEHVDSMSPEHVAPVYTYLASDLSRGMTGMTLTVAGGRVSLLRLSETGSQFKQADGGIWRPEELADSFQNVKRN